MCYNIWAKAIDQCASLEIRGARWAKSKVFKIFSKHVKTEKSGIFSGLVRVYSLWGVNSVKKRMKPRLNLFYQLVMI